MNRLLKYFITTLLISYSSLGITAIEIVECEDAQGNRSFQATCPPNFSQVGKKKIAIGTGSTEKSSNSNIQATLYSIPECEACDEIREFLGTRDIPITEKNVSDNIKLQNELTELTGALKVPTTVIGEEIITGYSRTKFLSVLEAAGYKDEGS